MYFMYEIITPYPINIRPSQNEKKMCPILSNFTPATLEFVWHIKSKIMRNTRIDRRGLQRNSWLNL